MSFPAQAVAPDEVLRRPRNLVDLFLSFTWLALQGFGGVLAVAQRELVENKRWMTREDFVEEWAVAQIMPGPNVINLAITLGSRYFGWRGATVALAGLIIAPLMLLLTLAVAYARFAASPQVAGALRGMGAIASGLIIATGLKLVPALEKNVLGIPLAALLGALAFTAIALLRLPLAWVLLALGGLAFTVAFVRLRG
jgi:chromate transporter